MIFGNDAPFEGEERERVVFAIVPRLLDDGRVAWLQRVRLIERAERHWVPGMGFRPLDPSQRGHWVTKSASLP